MQLQRHRRLWQRNRRLHHLRRRPVQLRLPHERRGGRARDPLHLQLARGRPRGDRDPQRRDHHLDRVRPRRPLAPPRALEPPRPLPRRGLDRPRRVRLVAAAAALGPLLRGPGLAHPPDGRARVALVRAGGCHDVPQDLAERLVDDLRRAHPVLLLHARPLQDRLRRRLGRHPRLDRPRGQVALPGRAVRREGRSRRAGARQPADRPRPRTRALHVGLHAGVVPHPRRLQGTPVQAPLHLRRERHPNRGRGERRAEGQERGHPRQAAEQEGRAGRGSAPQGEARRNAARRDAA
mmetsp:Transcript_13696/g.44015  ORF Transcript_13696/g.44015 Transcript_13696/m.44015 type:complete len:293 (-) Transcript_13696:227-1105(-)